MEERNIYKEDVVKFKINNQDNVYEYGVVFKLGWSKEDNDEDEENYNDYQKLTTDGIQNIDSKGRLKKKNDQDDDSYEDEDDENDSEVDEEEENDEDNEEEEDDDEEDEEEEPKFKVNSETGVLVHLIRAPVYLEIEYDQLEVIDRTVYLTDFVQRVGDSSNTKMLGKIVSTKKESLIYPFSYINDNPNIRLGQEFDKLVSAKVTKQPSLHFSEDYLVTNKSKTVVGAIENLHCDLKLKSLSNPNKIINIPNATVGSVYVIGLYDNTLCPGKLVKYKREKYVISSLTPSRIEVNWYYYIDEFDDPPPMITKATDVIPFKDEYDFSMIGESVLFENSNGEEEGGLVFLTKTMCKVVWQDGTITEEPSLNFVCVDSLTTDYFPGDAVNLAGGDRNSKWGVIKQYNPEKRTCSVYWDMGEGETEEENDISVYSIEYISEYNYDESDFVFKADPSNILPEADVVGQVIGRDKCRLLIQWNNGFKEYVYPSELYLIEDDDVDEDDEDDEDDDDEEGSENEQDKDEVVAETGKQSVDKNKKGILNYVVNSVKKFLNNGGEDDYADFKTTDSSSDSGSSPSKDDKEHSISEMINELDINNNNSATTESPNQTDNNNNFELLTSINNHAYFTEKSTITTKFLKTINNEFQLLRTSLPDGIFVKGYSERMNLLQALLIGPSDTVYENGIFIFDIYLPPTYPAVPPKVFYHSVTFKLHPNLYVNGNVCLSLLGTWHGNKVEEWQPGISNLLQVLVSIQGLILGCKEPYFLEAGYDSQIGTKIGRRNSSLYNEEVYLLNLEAILYYNNSKPTPFESIIAKHLNNKKQTILDRINQLYDQNNNYEVFGISKPLSEGFVGPFSKLRSKIQEMEV